MSFLRHTGKEEKLAIQEECKNSLTAFEFAFAFELNFSTDT